MNTLLYANEHRCPQTAEAVRTGTVVTPDLFAEVNDDASV